MGLGTGLNNVSDQSSTLSISRGSLDPSLHITPDNGRPFTVVLDRPVMHIGSDDRQEITLRFVGVSPRMARLTLEAGTHRFTNLSPYPEDVLVNGHFVEDAVLRNGDTIRLQDGGGAGVTLKYINPAGRDGGDTTQQQHPLNKSPYIIGRDPAASLHLDSLGVSWRHAQIVQAGAGHTIEDLDSTNGTFINDRQITGVYRLQRDDVIRIDQYLLVYKGDEGLVQLAATQSYRIDAIDLVMVFKVGVLRRQAIKTLHGVSLVIEPDEFVAIIGGSGSGKSTLLRALNGANRATGGSVRVNNDNLYQNYELYQPAIGYVPQTDIVHDALSVYESLYFGARLRFPNEPEAARQQRIASALEALRLTDVRDRPVGRLSGGQKKRVSIALELMAEPHLMFMDEPSSGLDPGLDRSMMETLRRLASRGNIVAVVTHTTLNIGMCDKLAFMARGQLVYYGPPRDALTFFKVRDYTEMYNRVRESPFGIGGEIAADDAATQWAEHYRRSDLYQRYVVEELDESQQNQYDSETILSNKRLRRSRSGSFLQQASALTARTLALARRDFRTIAALLIVLPLVGLFLGFISLDTIEGGRGQMLVDRFAEVDMDTFLLQRLPLYGLTVEDVTAADITFTPAPTPTTTIGGFSLGGALADETPAPRAEPPICANLDQIGTYTPSADAQRLLFMLSLSVTLLGIFASAYTIVEEKSLFLRERMSNLRIVPYLVSKIIVYGGLALLSCILALGALALGVRLPAMGVLLWGPLEIFITLALTALAGVSIGLLISALNRQVNAVTYAVLAVLFVQILLPGVLFEMDGPLEPPSRLTITRWSLEAMGTSTDILARDEQGRFVVKNVILNPNTCQPLREEAPRAFAAPSAVSVTYARDVEGLLLRWGALIGLSLVFLTMAFFALRRDESF